MTKDISVENEQVILATGGYDHTIKIWQTHSGICQRTMQHAESQINVLEITPDRRLLAAASYQHIRMYDLTSNNPNAVVNYEGVPKNITCIGFQEDTKWMYSGSEDGKVRIWDLRSNTNSCPKYFDVKAPVTTVCLHPNEVELYIGDQNGNVQRWDMRRDEYSVYIPEGDSMILGVSVDSNGSHLAAVNSKGRCYVWSILSQDDEPTRLSPKHKFDAHSRHVLKCKFSPDSNMLVTTSADQTAKIWRTTDYALVQELKHENQRWVWDAAFSSDSQYIFTGSSDNFARLWNLKTGTMEREYSGHQKAITALAFKDSTV